MDGTAVLSITWTRCIDCVKSNTPLWVFRGFPWCTCGFQEFPQGRWLIWAAERGGILVFRNFQIGWLKAWFSRVSMHGLVFKCFQPIAGLCPRWAMACWVVSQMSHDTWFRISHDKVISEIPCLVLGTCNPTSTWGWIEGSVLGTSTASLGGGASSAQALSSLGLSRLGPKGYGPK